MQNDSIHEILPPNLLNYKESQEFLNNLEPLGVKFGFERINYLLASIDYPHKKYKSILIAGTNGKGSTAAMTAAIIKEAGIRVGLYTSPHIEDFRERIRINGVYISEERVTALLNKICSCIGTKKGTCSLPILETQKEYPTYFEFMTALAFLHFAEENVDIAVLEVGMGGRLDATNVVIPIVSVITEIDFDHSEILGKDIASIAREKGGIIKPKGTVVLSSNNSEVIDQISEICDKMSASLFMLGKDFQGKRSEKTKFHQTFCFESPEYIFKALQLSLAGSHQIRNAASAIKAALLLNKSGFVISESYIRNALRKINIRGRLELIHENPRIILDMAHNPNAALALAKALSEDFHYKKLYIVLGIMKDKDIQNIIGILAPMAEIIFLTRPRTPRAAPLSLMKTEAEKHSTKVEIIEQVPVAVAEALSLAGKNDLICITGSCYTVGEARRLFSV